MKRLFVLAFLLIIGSILTKANAQSEDQKPPVGEYLYQIIESEGVEAAVAEYKELKKMESLKYDLTEQQLNALGYRLLNENKNPQAVAIFKLNAETYPESINVWDSLAEGYFNLGKKDLAEENYQKVLSMLESATELPVSRVNFFRNHAQNQLFILRNFDPPSEASINYVSFYGGFPAGRWDMQNIADFKEQEDVKLSYSGNNLYGSPVPQNVEQMMTGIPRTDVSTGYVGGDYRRFIERGLIADISDLWQQQGWDDVFPESFKKMASQGGKQYFMPMAYQWNPIWYRKDIFEKHSLSPPKTWKELLELCDRLNELGYIPFTIGVQNWPPPTARWFSTLNLRLNGPEFHEEVMKGEVPYTDDRIRNVFVHWRELFRNDAFADSSFANNYQAGIQAITSGSAVMYNLGEWIFESPPVRKMEAKLDFFSFPEMNPDVKQAEIVHAYGAFMRADNSNPEKSEALLKWLASKQSQQSNVKANSRVVANMDVDQSLYSDVQKRIINHINNTDVLVPLLEMNTHPDFAQQALNIFQDYWEHPEDIDAAMSKLEKARKEVFEVSDSSTNEMNSPCMENEMKRQFDFWVGEWDVYVDGKKKAESSIERTLDGCMILENYSTNGGFSGKSINFYDAKLEKWVQIWTDSQGNVSRYRGELRDGKMYFNGTNLSRNSEEAMVRMEFTPNSDGSVRQLFEQSTDGGETWETLFDGVYRSQK